jgi:hypothetical protein
MWIALLQCCPPLAPPAGSAEPSAPALLSFVEQLLQPSTPVLLLTALGGYVSLAANVVAAPCGSAAPAGVFKALALAAVAAAVAAGSDGGDGDGASGGAAHLLLEALLQALPEPLAAATAAGNPACARLCAKALCARLAGGEMLRLCSQLSRHPVCGTRETC